MTVATETRITRGRGLGWLLHLLALLICGACFTYGATLYESLPDPVPTHWGPDGSPDDWSPKSFGSVFFAPMMGAGVIIFLALVTAAVSKMDQADKDASPWKLYSREAVVRGTVAAMGGTSILLAVLFGFLAVAGWINPDRVPLWPAIVLTALILAVIPVSYAAASRWAHRTAHHQGIRPTEAEEQESRLWVAGVIYNNPEDPHVLVPKRAGTGVGWTVNVGSRKGRVVMGVVLGVFVVLPIVLGVVLAL